MYMDEWSMLRYCNGYIMYSRYDMLSPGEMQRLSFVRLFYHKPPFAGQYQVHVHNLYCNVIENGMNVYIGI